MIYDNKYITPIWSNNLKDVTFSPPHIRSKCLILTKLITKYAIHKSFRPINKVIIPIHGVVFPGLIPVY